MIALTPSRIAEILHAPVNNVSEHWPKIAECLESLGIGSEATAIAALATIRVECPPFRPVKEYGTDQAHEKSYGGRQDLGNIHPGDGARYAGRGFVQITGRNNYEYYGKQLGVNLVADPDAALEPNTAAMIFALYFKEHKVDVAANQGDWAKVRRLVNGGLNGFGEFRHYIRSLEDAVGPVPDVTGEISL